MSKKIKSLLTVIIIALLSFSVFVGVGYFYLDSNLEPVADKNTPSVPYYSEEPENVGISVEIGGQQNYFFLDFYYKRLNVIFDTESTDVEAMGYSVDHYVISDYSLLEAIVDRVGGIEIEAEGEILRYTGVQVTDMLTSSAEYDNSERDIILKIIEKISENGFQKEDFLYIIENSETTLTVPICYYWSDYIKEICKSVNKVN